MKLLRLWNQSESFEYPIESLSNITAMRALIEENRALIMQKDKALRRFSLKNSFDLFFSYINTHSPQGF